MSEAIANQARRVETLKSVVLARLRGSEPDAVALRLRDTVQKTEAAEILAIEQQLLDDGVAPADLAATGGGLLELVRDILVQRPDRPALPDGHPADTFRRENAALRRATTEARAALQAVEGGPEGEKGAATLRAKQTFLVLYDVEKHYARKQRLLLPALARHGFASPSRLTPIEDAAALSLILAAAAAFDATDGAAPFAAVERALAAVERVIDREEDILLPVALDALDAAAWAAIWSGSAALGWCLVQPGRSYRPDAGTKPRTDAGLGPVDLGTGRLSPTQLAALFRVLPVDLTFVDADDRVAYFNEGAGRLFDRPQAILGRKVQFCHPVGSIDLVDRILAEFRAGEREVAEFWIELGEKFVHIRFFAVRGDDGGYLGALEVVQDIAPLRRLEGQRRLLD